jgi:hypothetical protein
VNRQGFPLAAWGNLRHLDCVPGTGDRGPAGERRPPRGSHARSGGWREARRSGRRPAGRSGAAGGAAPAGGTVPSTPATPRRGKDRPSSASPAAELRTQRASGGRVLFWAVPLGEPSEGCPELTRRVRAGKKLILAQGRGWPCLPDRAGAARARRSCRIGLPAVNLGTGPPTAELECCVCRRPCRGGVHGNSPNRLAPAESAGARRPLRLRVTRPSCPVRGTWRVLRVLPPNTRSQKPRDSQPFRPLRRVLRVLGLFPLPGRRTTQTFSRPLRG